MNKFRLLKRTRQTTEYSCGASALMSVLAYWGNDVEEHELMRLMGTSEEEGTYPEKIANAARALGFEAEVRQGLTLDDVARITAKGDPMIALAQVWRGSRSGALGEDFDAGHYISVLGVDADNVYFQDPYVRNCKAFVPRGVFEEHWHHVMGGTAGTTRNPLLAHLGIVIRGKQPAQTDLADELKLALLLAAFVFARFGFFARQAGDDLFERAFDRDLHAVEENIGERARGGADVRDQVRIDGHPATPALPHHHQSRHPALRTMSGPR